MRLRITLHLRRLAEDHLEGHVDRRVAEMRVVDDEAALAVRARRRPRRDSARGRRSRRSGRGRPVQSPARSAPAPRCTRSRAATCQAPPTGPRAGRSVPPTPPPCTSSGKRVGQAAGADVVDRQDRIASRRAASSGRSPPARGAPSRRCRAAPNRNRGRRRSRRSPSTTRHRRPCRSASLARRAGSAASPPPAGACARGRRAMLPTPPAIMMGL